MKPRKIDYTQINRHQGLRPSALKQRYRRLRVTPLQEDLETDDHTASSHDEGCYCYICDQDRDETDAVALLRTQLRLHLQRTGSVTLAAFVPDAIKLALQGGPFRQNTTNIELREGRIAPQSLAFAILQYLEHFGSRNRKEMPIPADLLAYLDAPQNQELFATLLDGPLEGMEKHLIDVLVLHPFWVRDLQDWHCVEREPSAILRTLIDHLFVIFPVPAFFYQHWQQSSVSPSANWLHWFLLTAQGASLYAAGAVLGWKIPPRFPHHLSQAPKHLSFSQACSYAEWSRLGLRHLSYKRLCNRRELILDPTQASGDGHELEFSREMLLWLDHHHAAFTIAEINLVLEWARHKYTEAERRGLPRFSFAGRSPAAVLRATWEYVQVRNRGYFYNKTWKAQGWNWRGTNSGDRVWTVDELCSSQALDQEGLAMSHCVGGYDAHCSAGHAAIFSAKLAGARKFTIEYDLRLRRIAQARGACNRKLTETERLVLEQWVSFVHHLQEEKRMVLELTAR